MTNQTNQPLSPRSPILIRTYEPRDHSAVVDLLAAGLLLYPENRDGLQPEWQAVVDLAKEGDLADVEGTYFEPGGHYWVATCGDEVVGMIALKTQRGSTVAELRRLSVRASYHRCGIGRRLVQTFDDYARAHGFTEAWLTTGVTATPSHKLYAAFGFRHTETKVLHMGVEVFVLEKKY